MAETFQEFANDLVGVAPKPPVRERAIAPIEDFHRYTPTGEAIPLDENTGAPFSTRLRMSLVSDEATKKAIAQDAFANARVEAIPPRNKLGDTKFVIRDYKDPETGQVKDLLMDEKGASLKDLADMGEVGIQLLGAYMALRGGAGATSKLAPGFGRAAIEAAIGAAGGEALAGTAEAQQRAQAGQDVRPGEILARRSEQAVGSAAVGFGLSVPIIAGSKLMNLRRGLPQTADALEALQARNRLAEETGIDVPFSLGEATGSTSLRERELLLRKHILGGGRLGAQKEVQRESLLGMQEALPGTFGVPASELPSKDVVGTQAVSALRSLTTNAEEGTARARAGAIADATQDLSHAMTTSTGFADRQVLQDEAGNLARNVVKLKHEVLNEVEGELQSQARALGADQPFIATPQAKREIIDAVKNAYEKPGKPGTALETTPSSVLKVLNDVRGLPAQTTWDEMRRVRNSVNRLISEGQVLGDTDTGVLKQISSTLTDAINRGAKSLPPEASAAVLRANKFYSEGIEQFQVKGITDILADPTQRKLGPFSIFRQAADDPDQYFRLKDALTKPLILEGKVADAGSAAAGENAWNVFKQGMWDEMTDSSSKAANRTLLDPTKLLNKIQSLPTRVREDLLGESGDIATRALKRLETLDNPKLPAAEALDILRQGGDQAPAQIMQLALREQELDKLYANQVIKKFAKGDIGSEQIDPSQFVDRFTAAGPIADVRDAMNKLEMANPGMTKLVRSKQVQSILESASPLDDVASAKKLATEINSQESQERLKAVLGEPGTRRLNDFLTVLEHLQQKGDVGMGGSLAGGEAKSKMLTVLRAIHSLPAQIQYRFAAMVISNPNLYRMATGPVQPLDPSRLVRSIATSEDAIKALGSNMVGQIIGWTSKGSSQRNQPTQAEFEQQLNQK